MKSLLTLISTLLLTTSISNIVENQLKNQEATTGNLYVLGDSLSDTGALVGGGTQFVQANRLIFPKIKKVQLNAPYLNNSFTNGIVAAQVVANKLGVTLTPAWRFLSGLKIYQQIGNNYAVGGARASLDLSPTGIVLNNFTIGKQVDALLMQHGNKINANDKVSFEIGANDVMSAIWKNIPLERTTIINSTIYAEQLALTKLILFGAKHILVTDVPDMSLTPTFSKSITRKPIAEAVAKDYAAKWSDMINNLNGLYPNIIKTYSLDQNMKRLYTQFQALGGNITDAACTTDFNQVGIDGTLTPVYNPGVTPENINNYFSLDGVHPTKWAHEQLGNDVYNIIKNWN